jgi:hypothetical protein
LALYVYLQVNADVLEKHAVSIFRGWSDRTGKQRAYIGPEEQGLRAGSQREGIWEQCGPVVSLWEGCSEGAAYGVRKKRER